MQFVFDFTLTLTSSMLAATLGRLMQLMALHHSSSTPRHVPLLPLQLLHLRNGAVLVVPSPPEPVARTVGAS